MSDDRFSPDQSQTLAAVLDEIIPPGDDGRLPGAGALGLTEHIERELEKTPGFRPLIEQGLAKLDELAGARGAAGFAALAVPERREVLNEFAAADEAFLPSLIFHGYVGYYTHARVVEALGMEPRPPFPLGYEQPPDDLSLLDPVRERPKLYRDC